MPVGKILGFILGFFVKGFLGGIVGLILGHFFDKGRANMAGRMDPQKKSEIEAAFFNTVFPLLGFLSKADGRVSEEEVAGTEQLMTKMALSGAARKEAIRLFKVGSAEGFTVDSVLSNFIAVCGTYRDLKQILVVYLSTIAFSDGHLHEQEEVVLRDIAHRLGYSAFAFNHLIGMVKAQSHFYRDQQHSGASRVGASERELLMAYKALGVEPSITDAELKKAYRKLMSEFHPDKLAGKGVPDDMVKLATERSQEIQSAYEVIKKHRKR